MGGGNKERDEVSQRDHGEVWWGDVSSREKFKDLKEVKRRRQGGKLPPAFEQLLHSPSFIQRIHSQCCAALLSDAHTHSQQALRECVCSRAATEKKKKISRLSLGLQSGNNSPGVLVFKNWIKKDIWNPRGAWAGSSSLEWMNKRLKMTGWSSPGLIAPDDSPEVSDSTPTRCRCELYLLMRPRRIWTRSDETALTFSLRSQQPPAHHRHSFPSSKFTQLHFSNLTSKPGPIFRRDIVCLYSKHIVGL